MKTQSYPRIWSQVLPSGRSLLNWRQAMVEKCAVFPSLIVWMLTVAVVTLLIWMAGTETLWPRVICCVLLAIICTLIGIRLGTNSTAAYIKDVHRLNKVLADQNDQLQDANAILLKSSKKVSD